MLTNTDMLDAYLEMMQARIAAGFEPYLLTFMFKQVAGSEQAKALQMAREVERIYSLLLTRIVKRPHNTAVSEMPLLVGCLDWPVNKSEKIAVSDAQLNDGMHFHANMLVPPNARSMLTLNEIVDRHRHVFEGPGKPLSKLHVQPIESNARYVFGYGLKSVQRRRLRPDEILILPKAKSEVSDAVRNRE